MAPKKRGKIAAPVVAASPRRTRSFTLGKRATPTPSEKRSPAKKQKVTKEKKKNANVATKSDVDSSSEAIIVEACKQCKSFKMRANNVKEGLENAVPGIIVTINPDEPRRGCFEIRKESGEVFISLLDMKRPFKPMKDLDMDKVVEDIIGKIK